MKGTRDGASFLGKWLPWSIAVAFLLVCLAAHLLKRELQNEFLAIGFVLESDRAIEPSLYYSYSDRFEPGLNLTNSSDYWHSPVFELPREGKVVKKFRLDFGSQPIPAKISIKELRLIFKNREVVLADTDVFNAFYQNSPSITINRSNKTLQIDPDYRPFDPFIVFSPAGSLALSSRKFLSALLLPFFLMGLIFVVGNLKVRNATPGGALAGAFALSIPLKIAWTSFTAILLGLFGVVNAIRKRRLNWKAWNGQLLLVLFILIVLLGRPSSFADIEKELALVIFGIVGMTYCFNIERNYKDFCAVMLIFNAIMAAAGLAFLFWFKDFYGLNEWEYFYNIKLYSGFLREWLLYKHAAFLSFFGLSGLLLVHHLFSRRILNLHFVYLYHLLLLLFILITGTRVCLVVYGIIAVNLLAKWHWKKRLAINTVLLMAYTTGLFLIIGQIDPNRIQLWRLSWEVISENPWLGYGLDQSRQLLQDPLFKASAGVTGLSEYNHSHNQFLTMLMEYGLIGLLVMTSAVFYFLIRQRQYLNVELSIFLFALCYMFLTESILQTSKPLYVICFLFLLLAQETTTRSQQTNRPPGKCPDHTS